MREDRPSHSAPLSLGLAATIALVASSTIPGCGDKGAGTNIQISPEADKKRQDYLKSYQNQMYEQHKPKATQKGR